MKNIIKSLLVVVAVAAVAGGATWSYFSSTATSEDNTFSTGTLEIRINGEPSISGFSATNMAPGDCENGSFTVMNYGAPWFGGPSTLTAEELVVSATNIDDNDLCDALTVEVENCAGPCETAYSAGSLAGLDDTDLLMSWYGSGLATGNSETINYEVCLPDEGDQSDLQGMTCQFDFAVAGYTPHR